MIIITSISGGLGNQMFQYAAGRSLSLAQGAKLALHLTNAVPSRHKPAHDLFGLDQFNIAGRRFSGSPTAILAFYRLNRRLGNLLPLPRSVDDTHVYDPAFHAIKGSCWLRGVWRSHKYFEACEDVIRKDFDLTAYAAKSALINQIDDRTVSVHVRRGDFIQHPGTHPVVSEDYVRRAMAEFPNGRFLIFSDDISWCRETFVGDEFMFSDGKSAVEDMALMSACAHNIISNSTFGWWSAWLNKNPVKRVIAPTRWFGDDNANREHQEFLPPAWQRL